MYNFYQLIVMMIRKKKKQMGQVNIVPTETQTTPSKYVTMKIHNNSDFASFINDRNIFMKKTKQQNILFCEVHVSTRYSACLKHGFGLLKRLKFFNDYVATSAKITLNQSSLNSLKFRPMIEVLKVASIVWTTLF